MNKVASKPKRKAAKAALALVPAPIVMSDDENRQMGAQLTAQYRLAIGGMVEVVKFGAMMMQLREMHPELAKAGGDRRSLSKLGQCSEPAPLSLQKWLENNAPEVKRPTALRFLGVTESIAASYEDIVGKGFAKKFTLTTLLTTAADQLPADAAKKQLSFFDYIAGTSQKSWLDQFRESDRPGYTRRNDKTEVIAGKGKRKTAAELAKEAEEELKSVLSLLNGWFVAKHHTRVPKHLLTTADAVLEGARNKIKTVAD